MVDIFIYISESLIEGGGEERGSYTSCKFSVPYVAGKFVCSLDIL